MNKIAKRITIPLAAILTLLAPMTPLADTVSTTETQDVSAVNGSEEDSSRDVNETSKTFNDWFPDDNLARCVAQTLNKQPTDSVSTAELSSITLLRCSWEDIQDMSGLEYLTELQELDCGQNQLTELDISHNPKLVNLECEGNQLTELDMTHNPELQNLYCLRNQLTELDISHNPKLVDLECDGNQLTELDLTHNPELEHLVCHENQLTELDVSQNPKLDQINCTYNHITDFSSVLDQMEWLAGGEQEITLDTQKSAQGVLTIAVTDELKDEIGAAMNIYPSDGGVYDSETNTITWTNLPDSGEVSYFFMSNSESCCGTFYIPYQSDPDPTLTVDDTITYQVSENISEEQFLQDIHVATEEGNQIASDFDTVVDFSTPGDYVVTVTASNGTSSVERQVVVHVVKAADDTPVMPDQDDQQPSDDKAADKNTDSQAADENQSQQDTVTIKEQQKVSLPKTGDQSALGWAILGSAAGLLGVYLLKRK